MWQRSYDDSACLYLIPTPIGNMEDMTYRAINVLSSVNVIFSEDTRVTRNLLNYFNIDNKLVALHDHNEDVVKIKVLEYLQEGKSVAIVTDRGTPIVSDPGYKTVKYVSENGFNVVALPGANAFVPALIVSGLAPMPFTFYGFLDGRESKKRLELEKLKNVSNTLIFYESPHRILTTMKLMLEVFGNRDISISREISKKYESVFRGKISDVLASLENIKGEFVIVVAGANNRDIIDSNDSIYDRVCVYVNGGMKLMDAIKLVASESNIPKSEVYSLYHKEKE